jgi:serine/threonine-protein kinase
MNEDPTSPSVVAKQPIPPALDAAILRCLAKKPEDRFRDVSDLAKALGDIEFDPPWTSERAREWWRAHPPAGKP